MPIGVDYRLERLERNQWVHCNEGQAFIAIGLRLQPGQRRELVAAVPAGAPVGRYRLSKSVGAARDEQTQSFEFDVVAR